MEQFYSIGDPVLFRDEVKKKWKQGTALIRFGKILYLRHGNWLRRVPIDKVIPDCISLERESDKQIEPDSLVNEKPDVLKLREELENVREQLNQLKSQKCLEAPTISDEKAEEIPDFELSENTDIEKEELMKLKRKSRKERKKLKKTPMKTMPKLGQNILFKEHSTDDWIRGKVFGVFKKNSKHKNVKQIELEDGRSIERDFEKDIEEWKPVTEIEDVSVDLDAEKDQSSQSLNCLSDVIDEAYPIEHIKRADYFKADVQEAMRKEIEKYKSFNAFEEVDDMGQDNVPIRWVVTKHAIDGKNQPLKARLCIRGDLEKDKEFLRSDSPTAGKDTLKLALSIAANEGFTVKKRRY